MLPAEPLPSRVVTAPRQVTPWASVPAGFLACAPLVVACGVLLAGRRTTSLLGIVIVTVVAVATVHNLRITRRCRAAQRRAAAVVGIGPGPLVHVLPFWPRSSMVILFAELWPVDGDAPLGQIRIEVADRGFDPTVPFRAWGPLAPGEPIALTSADGRQLVLPRTLLGPPIPPGPPGPVTGLATGLLGWPTRCGPGDGAGLSRVDAAVDELRGRTIPAIAAFVVGGLGGGTIAVGALSPASPALGLLAGVGVVLLGLVATSAVHRAPVRDLVDPLAGGDRALASRVVRALWLARARPAPAAAPHGVRDAADGRG